MGEAPRASPDALLALARREEQGRLKVYFGAAPGVGKTFAMLQAARAARAEGVDVVIGIVETHGRRETEALAEGLETLSRRRVPHQGRIVEEFDIDEALQRRPALLLVDELAHTNAPDSRHPKRWQDVRELVDAGIDVWTTLNVQHLDSVNDIVLRITGVRVRETVPDKVFEEADEIVIVDLPSDELLKRLAEGKVYGGDTAHRARQNFFKPQNLAALRELALRRAAERVDSDLVERLQGGALEGPWPAGERLMACIGRDASATAVVRRAKRLADQVGAPLVVVTVERPGERIDGDRTAAAALRLAEGMGIETTTLVGQDIPATLLRFARSENITQIVMGRSRAGPLAEMLRRSLPHELLRRAEGISIHVITDDDSTMQRRWTLPALGAPAAWLWAACGVAVATGVASLLSAVVPLPNVSMVFLMAVLFPALRFGVGPAILASVLSFLAYNFFLIEPTYTLTVARPHELLALGIFLAIAVLTSTVAGKAREQAEAAAARVRATRRLYEFTRRLSAVSGTDNVAEAAAAEMHAALGRGVFIVVGRSVDELSLAAMWPPDDIDTTTWTAVRWAVERLEPAGAATGTLPQIPWHVMPLRHAQATIGAVGVALPGGSDLSTEERVLMETLAEQASAAIERTRLAQGMAAANSAAEAERVRNTLLASVSHDFRTPLASILGAASGLAELWDRLSPAQRQDLLGQIRSEAEHLDTMVRNLLSITRVEAGGLHVDRTWIDAREAVERSVATLRRRHPDRQVSLSVPAGLPLIRADATLLDQALGNLLQNAIRHGGPQARIAVEAEVRGDALHIAVIDDGPGIPADVLPRVFDKFVRSVPASGDGGESTGLGLAIAKGIVEAHGGTIRAVSPVADHAGTRIEIHLPLGEPAA